MQKINLLPSEIYNKISAGEVVENPASIVKELVENAIDAGSNNIVVDIVNGGITSVIVSDNGHGISKDYIKTAFLPHATSKIATSKDLENIATLGFRGEALPSIAAVSSVEIKTKAIDEFVGVKYTIKGGVSGEVSEIDCNNGTTIEVRNLFFNTPARQKFLKKPKSEEHEITAIIQGLILANPNIAIKYVADGKVIFNSNGKGLENALYAIYPNSITKHMIYLEIEKYDIKVQGYIGLPTLTKPNRNYQTTIVNGRLISNSTISTAVSQAYGNMLMKRCFPVFCLEIIMPFFKGSEEEKDFSQFCFYYAQFKRNMNFLEIELDAKITMTTYFEPIVEKSKNKKKKRKGFQAGNMRCPYCGSTVVYRSADGIYYDNSMRFADNRMWSFK